MLPCTNCSGCERFVPFSGATEPIIYAVAEAPGGEEVEQRQCLIGPTGSVLRKALKESGISIDRVRFGNVVRCRSIDSDGNNRNPSKDEIDACRHHVIEDIESTKPKVVLVCGGSALSGLRPGWEGPVFKSIENSLSENWRMENGTPYRVIYHPSYIHRRGGASNQDVWSRYIQDIKDAIKSVSLAGRVSAKEKLNWDLFETDQVDEFLDKFQTATEIGYDLEASSLVPLSKNFQLAGVGLSAGDYAAYLRIMDFWDQDNKLTPEISKKIGEFLLEAQERGVLVFNLEVRSTSDSQFIRSRAR